MESNRKCLCLVTLPNSACLAVGIDRNACGKEVLNEICKKIGTIEIDFFGLQHTSSSGEVLWLNLRNRVASELAGSSPYRFSLNIKFAIQPHFIQQESTRSQFYLILRRDFVDGNLHIDSVETVILLASLVVLHESLALESTTYFDLHYTSDCALCLPEKFRNPENVDSVIRLCQQLQTAEDSAAGSYRSKFLREVAKLEEYGMHYFQVQELGKSISVCVGPEGIVLRDLSRRTLSTIPFVALQSATHDSVHVDIVALQDDASSVLHRLSAASKCLANALYRDITEIHSFFHSNMVGGPVSEQFCRDFKGHFASLFNERTDLGKKYVFDIERTLKEAYDHVRRTLYVENVRRPCATPVDAAVKDLPKDVVNLKPIIQQLQDFHDACTCHVCVSAPISCVFIPCGHVACCTECANVLKSCPICMCLVDTVQPLFLPFVRPCLHFAPEDIH